jgi:hypothetical protein
MSELRSAIEALRADRLAELPDGRVEEDFLELQRAVEALEVERLRRLAELERRAVHAVDGHLSAASWLVARCRVGWGAARSDVRVARALEEMLRTRRALNEGVVSLASAKTLAEARRDDPEAFAAAEETLVDAALRLGVSDLHRVVAFWRQRVEHERALSGDDPLRARRRLHASVTLGGMVRLDGDLDPETGESVLTALRAVLDAEARLPDENDRRTPAQRRADALGEICRGWLDVGARPSVGGERPHVTVTVGVEGLVGDASAELDHVGRVHAELARALACDASVTRVVLGPRSEPLDVGRRTPVVSPAIRRAVVARDRWCRFPGCDRPHTWCDAHHVVHWAQGGSTSVANLMLLCRRHHRAVHERFGLELLDGRPVFRRPDGSILAEDRAPP